MFDFLMQLLLTLWSLLVSMGLYVLLGLVFVGIIHLYISEAWIKKHLGGSGFKSVLKGTLYGIPLPLCSCGVIPLATSLHKSGASKGAVSSFFITTPMTGVDSILATYGVFGWPMAVVRVVSAVISGLIAGMLVESQQKSSDNEMSVESECGCCGCHASAPKPKWKEAVDYALFEVFDDVVKPMIYGLFMAALLMLFIPKDLTHWLNDVPLLAYAGVLLIGLPMYVCSISAIPMALGMLFAGLSPGAAFVFLAAAPASNIITAGVIQKSLGTAALSAYLFSIVGVTILFAFGVDAMPEEWFRVQTMLDSEKHSLIETISGGIFGIMLFYFLMRAALKSKKQHI